MIVYAFALGFLFARWLAFASETIRRERLMARLHRWRSWPGWVDSLIASEHRT